MGTEGPVCSGIAFDYDPQTYINDTANGGNGVSSTFTWTAVYNGATNGTSSGSSNIAETLTNTTGSPVTVVYTVTPTSDSGACADRVHLLMQK